MAASPPVRRILIIRPSALGDVCRTVPVLVSLRRAHPEARIEWLVQEEFAPAIAAHPDLDEVVPFPRRRFARWWRSPRVAREMLGWLGGLRRRGYDLVLDVQGLGRSGLIAWATGAPRRAGDRRARELAWLGYTARHALPPGRHAVAHMLDLVEAEGVAAVPDLTLHVDPDDAAWWDGQRASLGLAAGGYEVFAPTGRWASKRWPFERWQRLLGDRGPDARPVVLVGAPGEEGQVPAHEAAGDPPVHDLVGRLSIGRTMAVIRDAALVVATDSAPLHMAVGFDRPSLALFGPTDPERVGPWGDSARIIQRLEPGECAEAGYRRAGPDRMARITVEEVRGALVQLRAAGAPAR